MQLIAKGTTYTARYDYRDGGYYIFLTGGAAIAVVSCPHFAKDIADGVAVRGTDGKFAYP